MNEWGRLFMNSDLWGVGKQSLKNGEIDVDGTGSTVTYADVVKREKKVRFKEDVSDGTVLHSLSDKRQQQKQQNRATDNAH